MEITKTDKKVIGVCLRYMKLEGDYIIPETFSLDWFLQQSIVREIDEINTIEIIENFIDKLSGSITYYRLASSDKRNLAILLRDLIEYDEEVGLDTNLIRSLTKIINKLKMKHLMGV